MCHSVQRLTAHQALILWSLRLLCQDPGWACLVRSEIVRRLPLTGVEALVALRGLASLLQRRGRRACCRPPEHDRVHALEAAVLALVAALQHGERTRAAAIAPWLVESAAVETLLAHAGRLAEALARADARLPTPPTAARPRPLAGRSFAAVRGIREREAHVAVPMR